LAAWGRWDQAPGREGWPETTSSQYPLLPLHNPFLPLDLLEHQLSPARLDAGHIPRREAADEDASRQRVFDALLAAG
jgi:hypothetical protein